jgi:DNA polymerase alpha subunit A
MNHQTQMNEIIMASVIVHSNISLENQTSQDRNQLGHYSVLRQLGSMPYPSGFSDMISKEGMKLELCPTERSLLNFLIGTYTPFFIFIFLPTFSLLFIAYIHRIDPDIIIGHKLIGYELDILLHRMRTYRVDHWSRIGRLRRAE